MDQIFSTPVCLMFFLRTDKLLKIIDVLRQVSPSIVYLLSDGPRSKEEFGKIQKARETIERALDWGCQIRRIYQDKNKGVYQNIACGAMKVFSEVPKAIFLEDDNLPSKSFFTYCQEMLNKYENNQQILWICGTNYLGEYENKAGDSYFFTQQLLPCGWASWSNKFLSNYDGLLETFSNKAKKKAFRKSFGSSTLLYLQEKAMIKIEIGNIKKKGRPHSWDYQMMWSLRANGLYGIAPKVNLINNIGVDDLSVHGGNNWASKMTRRFCGIPERELPFPLKDPDKVAIDKRFEKKTGKIIRHPLRSLLKTLISVFILKRAD